MKIRQAKKIVWGEGSGPHRRITQHQAWKRIRKELNSLYAAWRGEPTEETA